MKDNHPLYHWLELAGSGANPSSLKFRINLAGKSFEEILLELTADFYSIRNEKFEYSVADIYQKFKVGIKPGVPFFRHYDVKAELMNWCYECDGPQVHSVALPKREEFKSAKVSSTIYKCLSCNHESNQGSTAEQCSCDKCVVKKLNRLKAANHVGYQDFLARLKVQFGTTSLNSFDGPKIYGIFSKLQTFHRFKSGHNSLQLADLAALCRSGLVQINVSQEMYAIRNLLQVRNYSVENFEFVSKVMDAIALHSEAVDSLCNEAQDFLTNFSLDSTFITNLKSDIDWLVIEKFVFQHAEKMEIEIETLSMETRDNLMEMLKLMPLREALTAIRYCIKNAYSYAKERNLPRSHRRNIAVSNMNNLHLRYGRDKWAAPKAISDWELQEEFGISMNHYRDMVVFWEGVIAQGATISENLKSFIRQSPQFNALETNHVSS